MATIPEQYCPPSADSNVDLEYARRLGAMSELAAGLAREVQQSLTIISNYANGCVHRLEKGQISDTELRSLMKEIAAAAMQTNELTRRTREHCRDQAAPDLEKLDVNEFVHHAAEHVQDDAYQEQVAIRLELPEGLPEVIADPTQLLQVTVNLMLNSITAMADWQGRRMLTISTTNDDDGFVQVVVADTGPGIPIDVQRRIFDPFYTTRPNGLGLGLGLTRSIIERHGCQLKLESAEGNGTRVAFAIPTTGAD